MQMRITLIITFYFNYINLNNFGKSAARQCCQVFEYLMLPYLKADIHLKCIDFEGFVLPFHSQHNENELSVSNRTLNRILS